MKVKRFYFVVFIIITSQTNR